MSIGIDGRCLRCGVRVESSAGCLPCAQELLNPSRNRPHTCPVCNGAGTVSRPPWVAGDQPEWMSSNASDTYECHACKGSGIVWEAK